MIFLRTAVHVAYVRMYDDIIYYVMLYTGKVWFTQKIPIMVPTEGACIHTCMYIHHSLLK